MPARSELADPLLYLRGVVLHQRLASAGTTMLSSRRGRALHRLAATVERDRVPGALVDCGAWNGGSTVLLAAGAPSRDVWAFDSFEGLPEPGPLDGALSVGRGATLRGSEERLRAAVARYADRARLHVAKGWFADTFPVHAGRIDAVAVLHVDGDWYESVELTLETFHAKVPAGGFVVVDDYGHWEGARRATDEFRRAHGITAPLVKIDYTGRYWRVAASA